MKAQTAVGHGYRLPGGLNGFQTALYIHLINWKWIHLTEEPGVYYYRGREIPYDAIIPEEMRKDLPMIYGPVADELRRHSAGNGFRLHTHFHHMASSQAACVNLFLPILRHSRVNEVLSSLRPDFASLATDQLDQGYCIEFWGGNFGTDKSDRGPLGDKSALGGTDSDLAIAYRNHAGELCLWLIEHKLTEAEFTPCGGFKSRGRKAHPACECTLSFAEILADKDLCYHHHVLDRHYWTLTGQSGDLFAGHTSHAQCPFQGGMNQLWRNQLLAYAIEQDEEQVFRHASFSVVKHADNVHLDKTLKEFAELVSNHPMFSVLTSDDVLKAAEALQDNALAEWATWYRTLYNA